MATYDNDLRLKEITTGDEDGTWGVSTNTNLELIADGFSLGTKEMTADADETFTMPDATADATRSLYLKITSAASLTATRVITLGPNTVSKTWIIENATSGSQIITIKQGSGATVDVANGGKTMVVTDGAGAGAAVINANPSGATGTVTSVGGTGTVQGLTLTGTVTSSGNLTLGGTLDDIDLTSGVTGTLPVANGGTGATTLTANNVLLGNGTSAPQAVAPSTSGNVLTSDGTTWASTAPAAGGFSAMDVITSSNASYSIPAETIKIIVVGGGGGGAATGSAGGSGGASSAASGTETISTITGNGGGGGGYGNASTSYGGTGGYASGGTLNSTGGGGGGFATNGPSAQAMGAGGDSRFGGGGRGATGTYATGGPGGAYGGGGAGQYAGYGAGGGGGGTAEKYLTGLTVGNTLNLTIGAGGTGNSGRAGVIIIEY